MSLDAWLTIAILAATFVALLATRVPPVVVFLGALTLSVSFGLAPLDRSLAGFSNSGVLTIGALFMVAAGMYSTGAISLLSERLIGRPRSLLGAIPGVDLVEMERHRDYAWCCGYGADLVSSMRPDLASQIAADRMAEARETGAEALVTACPRCARGLSKAGDGMKVYDLAVALAKSMGLSF